ncbi:MAG: protein kinase [Pirellulaceae bacterium]
MPSNPTHRQSTEEQDEARELSLQKARPPADVPGYTIQRLLGRGAFGEVWIGVDRNTGRQVAIKFYAHRSGVDWTLLSREVEKLVYLSADRYVVQLLDVGWDAEPPYYVMDYIENGSLEDLLSKYGSLATSEALDLVYEIAIGLMHAHGKGVLHCDLKPANILLDQDHKPRLADFGQSRLSHEQTPALGTLFYMAPEQADLNALPDARWDVYALGAIFYRVLTGEPPFRSDEAIQRIEEAGDLGERLARYRAVIRSVATPAAHRRVPGVDRTLGDIIDRCLAVDSKQRFPNAQTVLDALQTRAASRLRRPLMLLGFVGPVLLLFIMAWFGLRGYDFAVRDSEKMVRQRAWESNEFAAKFAARSIESEIDRYFRLIHTEADAFELYDKFVPVADAEIVAQLNDPANTPEQIAGLRPAFMQHEARRALHDYMQTRLSYYLDKLQDDPGQPKFASMLALDAKGRMLAVAYDRQMDPRSVGWNYAYRTYFHGGPADLPGVTKEDQPQGVCPIRDTHLSSAFLSTSTGTWKVAVSTPVFTRGEPAGEVAGVLALTLHLGDFAYFRSNTRPDRFAVLIDGREGPNQGVILQHPSFDSLRIQTAGSSGRRRAPRFRVSAEQLERIRQGTESLYQDPVRPAEVGEPHAGDWIAAMETVRLPLAPPARQDMLVLVQEKYSEAARPVKELGDQLKREALWAIAGVTGVVLVLWFIVLRTLHEPRAVLRRISSEAAPPTPPHDLTTLPSAQRKKPDS